MRILFVEDDQGLGKAVSQALTEDGHAVDWSVHGQEGEDFALLEPYDLLVLDWMLPGRSGLEICRRFRAEGRDAPVLLLTARDAVEDRVSGLDSGADDYLVKPFALQELLARVRALLRRREGMSRDPILRARGVALDPSRHEVTSEGETVALTKKEYQLLECFLRHPGQLLNREQIAAHIWDFDYSATSNVVDVYVRGLRRKLGDDNLIRTVRGAGYQLDP